MKTAIVIGAVYLTAGLGFAVYTASAAANRRPAFNGFDQEGPAAALAETVLLWPAALVFMLAKG